MTRKNEKGKSHNPPEKSVSPTKANPYNAGNSGNPHKSANEGNNNERDSNENPVVVSVIQPGIRDAENEANRIAEKANDISRSSVKVNTGLLVVTIALALLSTCQYITSQNAAKIAQRTLDTTRKYDSISMAKQDDAAESSDRYNTNQLAVQKESNAMADKNSKDAIQAQIASISQTQQDFELENKAYLQVAQFDTLKLGYSHQEFTLNISNLGNQPAMVIEGGLFLAFGQSGISYKQLIDTMAVHGQQIKIIAENTYVIKGAPVPKFYSTDVDISKHLIGLKDGTKNVYIIGKFHCKNLLTGKKFIYEFGTILRFNPIKAYNMLYNENYDTK